MERPFTIPVAFVIGGEDELSAAKKLVAILEPLDLEGKFTPDPHYPIDSWWMPNHPEADNSDDSGPKLVWQYED